MVQVAGSLPFVWEIWIEFLTPEDWTNTWNLFPPLKYMCMWARIQSIEKWTELMRLQISWASVDVMILRHFQILKRLSSIVYAIKDSWGPAAGRLSFSKLSGVTEFQSETWCERILKHRGVFGMWMDQGESQFEWDLVLESLCQRHPFSQGILIFMKETWSESIDLSWNTQVSIPPLYPTRCWACCLVYLCLTETSHKLDNNYTYSYDCGGSNKWLELRLVPDT